MQNLKNYTAHPETLGWAINHPQKTSLSADLLTARKRFIERPDVQMLFKAGCLKFWEIMKAGCSKFWKITKKICHGVQF